MTRARIPIETLVAHVFGDAASPLALEVGGLLRASPRFRMFIETYRDKVRRKLRGVRDEEGARDLAFELRIARDLLADPRLELEYEPYGVERRAPDFRATFRSRVAFNVEVRRLRGAADASRIGRIVSDKLGQLQPSIINVLVLGGPGDSHVIAPYVARSIERDMSPEQTRALRRLSAIVWWAETSERTLWTHARARHPVPADLIRALAPEVLHQW